MTNRARLDPRRRALRAAARVALVGTSVGCGAAPGEDLSLPAAAAAAPPPDAGVEDAASVPEPLDGGTIIVTDAGVVQDAGLADAGGEFCDLATLEPDDYAACCERLGWDWERGCAAWGPPAPPSAKGIA